MFTRIQTFVRPHIFFIRICGNGALHHSVERVSKQYGFGVQIHWFSCELQKADSCNKLVCGFKNIWIRLNGTLNRCVERSQNNTVLVTGFTDFVSTEGQFVSKSMGCSIRIRVDVAYARTIEWNSDFSNHLRKSKLVRIIGRVSKITVIDWCRDIAGRFELNRILENFEKPKVREIGILVLVFIRLRTQHLLWNYESLLQRHRLTQIHRLSVTRIFVCVFKHELTQIWDILKISGTKACCKRRATAVPNSAATSTRIRIF